jgi:hypothetical protein
MAVAQNGHNLDRPTAVSLKPQPRLPLLGGLP